MIRIFDFLIALIGIIILMPLMILISLILYLENKSPFFFQERVGKNLKNFTLIKFRTMSKGTEICATHLVDTSRITNLGSLISAAAIPTLCLYPLERNLIFLS